MITVNMTKARELKRNQIRAERKPLLDSLDVEFMRASEAGDTSKQQEIATKKQALRDSTDDPAIDSATTPEELAAVNPLKAYQSDMASQ